MNTTTYSYTPDLRVATSSARLMMVAKAIARHLAYAAQADDEYPKDYTELPKAAQERLVLLAKAAIRNTDPTRREGIADAAVSEVVEWMNGPYMGAGTEPKTEDIAREAIARFCALELR